MPDSVSSTRPKVSIQTARMLHGIWVTGCINCQVRIRWTRYLLMDEYSDNADNGGSTRGHPTNEELNDAPNPNLASRSHQNVVDEPVPNPVKELVDSTHTDHGDVDLPTFSAHKDAEKMPVSSTFKFVLNVQLMLLFIFALFWVLSEM
ncbi:hypothetical protein MSAN_00300600 [Mycena sanguinolenta]|uniref:Uncharacterized protein n=1 Tax=Mycena sanguinolenta TaxID=230812 RepID=A0A8H7DI92_9AGAR|nr:hypothetical protein MSAN_00300600 [Mycena sanguinolenta]